MDNACSAFLTMEGKLTRPLTGSSSTWPRRARPHRPVGRLLFNVLAMVAEFEADLARMRTRSAKCCSEPGAAQCEHWQVRLQGGRRDR